jgi:glycerol-3-phosphate cytidylyltransferase-like family protein
LKRAKDLGDELIIILASDENNKKPYAVSEEKRKKDLESLNIADKILIGDSEDKKKIVNKIKPNIIALGYDQELPEGLENFKCIRIEKLSGYSTNLRTKKNF